MGRASVVARPVGGGNKVFISELTLSSEITGDGKSISMPSTGFLPTGCMLCYLSNEEGPKIVSSPFTLISLFATETGHDEVLAYKGSDGAYIMLRGPRYNYGYYLDITFKEDWVIITMRDNSVRMRAGRYRWVAWRK